MSHGSKITGITENDNSVYLNRTENGKFKKGVSGNPGGRKAMSPELKEIFYAATFDAAKLLIAVINDCTEKTENRIKASEIVLDRVYGKAHQAIQAQVENSTNIDLSGLTIEQLLLLANVEKPKEITD